MPKHDMRSPLAKARDEWIESKRSDIDQWARESHTHSKYIQSRLEREFLAGANAQETISKRHGIEEALRRDR